MKKRYIVQIFVFSLLSLFLAFEAASEEDPLSEFIVQIQKSLNERNIPAYLENFQEELRTEEEASIKVDFDQLLMDRVTLYKAGKLNQTADETIVFLQALFQNSFSAKIENWRLSLIQADGRWKVSKKSIIGSISTLYKIKIPSERIERVNSIEIEHVDLKLIFKDALVFFDNIPELETALLVVGKGRLIFSPSDPEEQHQLDLIYKKSSLDDELSYAYLRFSNHFFNNNIRIEKDTDDFQVSDLERNNAYSLFSKHYSNSFTVENSLNKELYSALPQAEEAVIDFSGKKYGNLTYIYSPFSDEEVHLYRWKDEKIINLYSPFVKENKRRMVVTFGEMFEVKNYKIDIDFNPKQSFLSGKAEVEIEPKVDFLERVKLKLNPKLEILRIYDQEMHELFYSRDKMRELLYVYFVNPPSREKPCTIEIFYRGKISPPKQVEDVVSLYQKQPESIVFNPPSFETYLFTRRPYWYPSPPDDDYFTAKLRIIVPPGYGCVSNGELIEQSKLNGVEKVEEVDKIGSSVYIFETKYPLKYVSFIVGDISKTREDKGSIPLRLYASSGISFQKKGLVEDAKKIIQFYEGKFGPFPYEKLSIVERIWPSAGGHCSPSFIVLNEPPQVAEGGHYVNVRSPVDLSRWKEYVIAHEIAHQWWGHAVTWKTYHDQWLSEGLAQFAAALYLRECHGEDAYSFILKKFSRWTEKYSKSGPITLGSRLSFFNFLAYQSIIYNKTSLALNLLKDLLGEEVFFEGLREFFGEYKYSVASTRDFIRIMERVSGKDLANFFKHWFDSYLLPELKVTHSVKKEREGLMLTVRVTQLREHFLFPLWIEWLESGKKVRKMLIVDDQAKAFELELKEKPKKIRVNPDSALPGKIL
jgi:hypothetical protein